MKRTGYLLLGASLTAITLPTGALAQTTTANSATPVAQTQTEAEQTPATPENNSGEVIVTAQRRNERLQDVPISLAVVRGDTLQTRSVQTFEQLAPLVPNLTIAKSPGANAIFLRGIGSAPGSPSLDQSVVMFIDGIYAGNARQFSTPFLDIERLEVLRGPQGALVGRNTSAGAINIITRKPGKDFGGYVTADYDFDFNGPTVEGAVDVPVSDAFQLRVAGKYGDVGGYIYNSLEDQKQPKRRENVERVTGVVDNGGPVKLTAKYEHAFVRVTGQPVQAIAPVVGEFLDYRKATQLPAGFGPEYDKVHTHNGVFQADIDLGGPTLVSISGYSAFRQRQLIDADFFSGSFAYAQFGQNFEQYSQELRLVSPADQAFTYVVGAYGSVADLRELRSSGILFAPAASNYRTFKQEDTVGSVYAQATYKFSDAFRFTGSLRYTHDRKTGRYVQIAGPLSASQQIGTVNRDFSQKLSDGRLDPAASVQFNANRNIMFYASYSSGSKVGGFQGAISNAAAGSYSFLPEEADAYEIGTKLTFPNLGYLNLAGFRTDYKNLQVTTAIPTPGSLVALFFTGNAPKARTSGVEAEFSVKPISYFTLNGSLAWLPTAKYVDFTAGPCYVQQPSDGSVAGSCNQNGNRLAFAPKYSGSVTAAVAAPVGSGLLFKAAVSPIFQGRSYRDLAHDPLTVQKSYLKLDARIGIAGAQDQWELAVVGQNLTNRKTLAFASAGGLANTFLSPTARVGIIDPPRHIAIQGRIKF